MMRWYYQLKGAHVHVRVFSKGALNGTLIFSSDEFYLIRENNKGGLITLINDQKADLKPENLIRPDNAR